MKSFHDTVWKITAALILIKPGIDEKLVFALTRAPLKLFNAATMKVKYSGFEQGWQRPRGRPEFGGRLLCRVPDHGDHAGGPAAGAAGCQHGCQDIMW